MFYLCWVRLFSGDSCVGGYCVCVMFLVWTSSNLMLNLLTGKGETVILESISCSGYNYVYGNHVHVCWHYSEVFFLCGILLFSRDSCVIGYRVD